MIPIAKPMISADEKKIVLEVLSSGQLAHGEFVEEFEKKFARYTGVKYAVAVSSGTAALHISLLSIGVKHNDEVITTPFSFIATASAILMCGARIKFVDIDLDTFTLDIDALSCCTSENTKAILPVHLFGQCCDMNEINKIARESNAVVVEDACQSHGAEYRNKRAGSMGACGTFSFYPTKNMTTGEGGMITTNSKMIKNACSVLRNQGQIKRYGYIRLGYNYRMTNISAAIGICQLEKLNEFNDIRRRNAEILSDILKKVKDVVIPQIAEKRKHVFHQYTIRCRSRNLLKKYLEKNGIATGIYYPKPLYSYEFVRDKCENNRLPNTERACREVLSLPIHPGVKREEIEYIGKKISEYYR